MRFNRGTISLLAILLVVIVAVLVINNQQANAPGEETPTPAAAAGALLPNVAAENIVRFEVRDNNTGDFTAITKDAGGLWVIDSTNALADRVAEQSLIDTTAGQIVAINYSNTFPDSGLANFGLESPDYTILVTTTDGQLHVIYIGDKQPTGPRYYAVLAQEAAPEATASPDAASTADATAEAQATSEAMSDAQATAETTAEATAEQVENPRVILSGEQTIYLIPLTVIDTLKRWLTTPPYAPVPTPGAESTVQPTPLLEEGASGDLIGEGTPFATQEATSEATAEATAAS